MRNLTIDSERLWGDLMETAAFGATLHVCGPDRAALEQAIAPHRNYSGIVWEQAEPSLEDIFIHLMGRARDNAPGA